MHRTVKRLLLVATLLAAGLFALSDLLDYPLRNLALDRPIDGVSGYRGQQIGASPLPGNLVALTLSGGGTRAAALSVGVMQALRAIPVGDGPATMLDAVDVVSSVSGGSVAAGYLALAGPAGLDGIRDRFLLRDGLGTMLWRGLNPYGLARLALPSFERIDLLIDYLDETLFHGATYDDLRRPDSEGGGWRRPYIILNAADIGAEALFPFQQFRFDLICSDLSRLPLAVAVAASAAVPVAYSPVTLRNYTGKGGCAAQRDHVAEAWPPPWTAAANATAQDPDAVYSDPELVRRARVVAGYLALPGARRQPKYVHLLDGAIVDDLGVSDMVRLMTTREALPHAAEQPPALDAALRNILLVVMDARTHPHSRFGRTPDTLGIADMLSVSIRSAIDNAAGNVLGELNQRIQTLRASLPADAPLAVHAAELRFAQISDTACRTAFQAIPLSWTLTTAQVDALIAMGGTLLWKAPGFRAFLRRQADAGTFHGEIWDRDRIAAAEATACRILLAQPGAVADG